MTVDPRNGHPYCNAVVQQDTRTDSIACSLEGGGHGEIIRHTNTRRARGHLRGLDNNKAPGCWPGAFAWSG